MKIYIGKNKKNVEEVNLMELLDTIFKKAGFETETGDSDYEEGSWVIIKKTKSTEKEFKAKDGEVVGEEIQVIIDISKNGKEIENMTIWKYDIKLQIDEENSIKIV